MPNRELFEVNLVGSWERDGTYSDDVDDLVKNLKQDFTDSVLVTVDGKSTSPVCGDVTCDYCAPEENLAGTFDITFDVIAYFEREAFEKAVEELLDWLDDNTCDPPSLNFLPL